MDSRRELKEIRSLLTAMTGRIIQQSDRKAGVALGAATTTVAGSATVSSIMGVVGSLGTASTGTAIASLAGAAKTTASLYWIGGVVGGGVAAGGALLGVGALGAGVYGARKMRGSVLGRSRRDDLSTEEQRIIFAITTLIQAIDQRLNRPQSISRREIQLFCRIGIEPVRVAIQAALDRGIFSELKTYHRMRLRGHVINLASLQSRILS